MEIEAQLAEEAKERQRAAAAEGGRRSGEVRREKAKSESQSPKEEPTKVVAIVPQPSRPEPKARDRAAALVGTNPRYIQDVCVME